MSETAIQLGSHVTPIKENTVARTADNDFRHFHPRQRLVVISLGCGLAICHLVDADPADLVSLQVADLELW